MRGSAEPEDLRPRTFDEEETADLRRQYIRQGVRIVLAFAVLFAAVYCALSWSGAAVRFSASRVGDRGSPAWHVTGIVRDANTRQPIPWATVMDEPSGRPPLFRADADRFGAFDLLTFPEPHRIRVTAPGYKPAMLRVGRAWFLWLPRGSERCEPVLLPE